MFCPKCGKDDQEYNTYCRNCGEFIMDAQKARSQAFFGDSTNNKVGLPILKNYVLIAVFFGGLSCFGSLCIMFILMLFLYKTDNPLFYQTLFWGLLFLSLQITAVYFSNKALNGLLSHARENERIKDSINEKKIQGLSDSDKKLPDADFENIVPPSVLEDTTKELVEDKTKKLS